MLKRLDEWWSLVAGNWVKLVVIVPSPLLMGREEKKLAGRQGIGETGGGRGRVMGGCGVEVI